MQLTGAGRQAGAVMHKWIKPLSIGIAFVAAVAIGGPAISARPLHVPVPVPEKDMPIRVFGLGTVESRVVSKVGFEVGATPVELNADHGDRVEKGKVLARLATSEQEAKVAKATVACRWRDRSSRP